MPVLNFKKEFVKKIMSGEKRQTIRALRKDGRDPKKGQILYLYTGMRTKSCVKLMDAECVSSEAILIMDNGDIVINGVDLTVDEKYQLAKADGFDYIDDFRNFFIKTHGLPFEGRLIKW